MLVLGLFGLISPPALLPVLQGPEPQSGRREAVHEEVTHDGLRIWSFPDDDDANRFLLMVLVGAGSRHEDPASSGVAHLLEHVVLSSTETQTNTDATRALADHNGQFNGWTSHDLTVYYVLISPNSWEFAVEWLSDHVVRPALSDQDIAAEQAIVYEELDSSQPHAGAITFEERLYPDHPLGRDVGGKKKRIAKQGRAELRSFYDAHYRAPNMAVGFAGRVPTDEVVEAIRVAFSGLSNGGGVSTFEAARPAAIQAGRQGLGSPTESGWIVTGHHLPAGNAHETAAQLHLLAHLDDRAFDEIREARQLSYAPAVTLQRFADTVRLDFHVEYSKGKSLTTIIDVLNSLTREVQDPLRLEQSEAIARRRPVLRVNSAEQLSNAMTLGWAMARAGQSPHDLQLAHESIAPAEIAAYAREHLTDENQFVLSNSRLTAEPAKPLVVALAILIALAVFDGLRGFPWSSRIQLAYRRFRAKRAHANSRRIAAKSSAAPAAGQATGPGATAPGALPFRPVTGDELEKSIQDFYTEVDQDSGNE